MASAPQVGTQASLKTSPSRGSISWAWIGIVPFFLFAVLFLILPTLKPVGTITYTPMKNGPQVNISGMGDPNAPVKVIEYSDFQCPYCLRFLNDTEQQIIDTYVTTGKVYFEYHSFGSFIGAESGRAAEAAYCASDQGKFWEMHDIIFSNQGAENSGALADNRLTAYAAKIGLDAGKFSDCFSSGKYASRVSQDGVDAQSAGVQATPSFVVNGTLVEGAQPFSAFQTKIDALLKK